MTSSADAEKPPAIDDTDPNWLTDVNEWMSYQCAARRCYFRMGVKDRYLFVVVAAD
jgi:hypothetical protein